MKNNPNSDLPHLESLLNDLEKRPMRESLEPVRNEVQRLVEDHFTGTVVQVIGSNGKGSVVHYTNELISTTNQSFVSFTSPHLETIGERIQLNGKALTDDEMNQLLSDLTPNVRKEFTPFERLMIAAITLAIRHDVETLLLEAGMGGRWDATSALPADITVLTSVDLEHTEYLGETKLDILKEQTAQIPETSTVIAPELDQPELNKRMRTIVGNRNLTRIKINSQEPPDRTNRALSLILSRLLSNTDSSTLSNRLDSVALPPGRQEILQVRNRAVLFDVAHTPESIHNWIRRSRSEGGESRGVFVLGLLKGKNVEGITKTLQNHLEPDQIIVTEPPSTRAMNPETIQSYWGSDRIPLMEKDPMDALIEAFRLDPDNLVAVGGSFTLVRYFKNNLDSIQ